MQLAKVILVPVDFSPFAERALDYAVALATALDAKVHIFHCATLPSYGVPELSAAVTASWIEQLVEDGKAALHKLADARGASERIAGTLLRTGDARDEIVRVCEELRVDLVVMGTHGRRGVRRALLGSVAESVVRTAPCPVLTVRGTGPLN